MAQSYQPSEYLKKAIEEKNVRHIRNALVNEITFFPESDGKEFEDALAYIKGLNISNVEEKYCLQHGETEKDTDINCNDKTGWDRNYWAHLLAFLSDNFCPEKRAPKIKQVTQYIHANHQQASKNTYVPKTPNPTQTPIKTTSKKVNWGLLIATIVAMIAMIAVIIALFRKQ